MIITKERCISRYIKEFLLSIVTIFFSLLIVFAVIFTFTGSLKGQEKELVLVSFLFALIIAAGMIPLVSWLYVPKEISMNIPRAKVFKNLLIYDSVVLLTVMILFQLISLIHFGDGFSPISIEEFFKVFIIAYVFISFIEFIGFTFRTLQGYYGLSVIAILIGLVVCFYKEIRIFLIVSNDLYKIIFFSLILSILIYMNYKLIRKMEIRG